MCHGAKERDISTRGSQVVRTARVETPAWLLTAGNCGSSRRKTQPLASASTSPYILAAGPTATHHHWGLWGEPISLRKVRGHLWTDVKQSGKTSKQWWGQEREGHRGAPNRVFCFQMLGSYWQTTRKFGSFLGLRPRLYLEDSQAKTT